MWIWKVLSKKDKVIYSLKRTSLGFWNIQEVCKQLFMVMNNWHSCIMEFLYTKLFYQNDHLKDTSTEGQAILCFYFQVISKCCIEKTCSDLFFCLSPWQWALNIFFRGFLQNFIHVTRILKTRVVYSNFAACFKKSNVCWYKECSEIGGNFLFNKKQTQFLK